MCCSYSPSLWGWVWKIHCHTHPDNPGNGPRDIPRVSKPILSLPLVGGIYAKLRIIVKNFSHKPHGVLVIMKFVKKCTTNMNGFITSFYTNITITVPTPTGLIVFTAHYKEFCWQSESLFIIFGIYKLSFIIYNICALDQIGGSKLGECGSAGTVYALCMLSTHRGMFENQFWKSFLNMFSICASVTFSLRQLYSSELVPPHVKIALMTVFTNLFHTTHQNKVLAAWEHCIFKNVDLVAIQSSDPQAWIFKWPIFNKNR